jgi:hypothetical protein
MFFVIKITSLYIIHFVRLSGFKNLISLMHESKINKIKIFIIFSKYTVY